MANFKDIRKSFSSAVLLGPCLSFGTHHFEVDSLLKKGAPTVHWDSLPRHAIRNSVYGSISTIGYNICRKEFNINPYTSAYFSGYLGGMCSSYWNNSFIMNKDIGFKYSYISGLKGGIIFAMAIYPLASQNKNFEKRSWFEDAATIAIGTTLICNPIDASKVSHLTSDLKPGNIQSLYRGAASMYFTHFYVFALLYYKFANVRV